MKLPTLTVFLLLPLLTSATLGGPSPKSDDRRNLLRRFQFWKHRNSAINQDSNTSPPSCSPTNGCSVDQYCSGGQCLDNGKCASDVDCRNPRNEYAVIECTGPLKCDEAGKCGRTCGPTCEDGTFGIQCLAFPCSVTNTTCETMTAMSIDSCVNDYCGGCTALVFDGAGNHEECVGPAPPGSSFCPGGAAPVNCLIQPCSVVSCVEEYAFCLDDYCNGCGTVLLDKAGNEVNCTRPQ